ncbi:MAG TPA: LuxR C-terminal-related transcriptional regulator [Nonomuraea sp.]|nr:LuxR C-terminal-related transcriptional regulator [Nonomuraea sp.]
MLRGRQEEQTRIDALLAAAREGVSAALVVRGDPGIGKTALLAHASAQARGMRALRSAGIESEAQLPFAGLHMLLRGELGRLDALPAPQRRALSGAFGLDAGGGGDRFMVGAGVLSLLADLAEQAPLLCLIDDAQWLDRASAEALLFAARRIDREGIVLLFGVRDYVGALDSPGIPELRLAGLDAPSAAAVLDDTGVVLPAALRDRLVSETGGNPLALRELPPLLSERTVAASPIPLTSRVLDAFHHQVRALPAPSRSWLLLAAADDTGELAVLAPAATELGLALDDVQPAEARGLVALEAGTVTFRHPLIRASVYHGASLGQRIAAHAALAAAYGARQETDRQAWHLAAAATGPDERVAERLELAAKRAIARHGYAAAAATYERAAQLSQEPAAATRRLVLACEASLHGGEPDRARARAERLSPSVTDPAIQTRLIAVRAGADFVTGALHRAHALLTAGASLIAAGDRSRAFWMLLEAVHASWALPTDERLMARTVDRFEALDLEPADPLAPVAWLVRWATAVPLGRDPAGFPPLAQVLPAALDAAAAVGPRALVRMGTMAFATGRDDESAELATALVADARAGGMIDALPGGLGHLSMVQTQLGRHREALISGTEGLRIAHDTGQPLWVSYAAGALSYLAAAEGDEPAFQRYADQAALTRDAPTGARPGTPLAHAARALLDLGLGRVQDAFDGYHALVKGSYRHQGIAFRIIPDLVEAGVRLGRGHDVTVPLARYTTWAATLRLPWIDALLARCEAMTAPDAEAESHYQRALALHEPESRPLERARTELLYGEWLRRSRRKTDARTHLTSALHAFEELGAVPWAARARAELGAAGAPVVGATRLDTYAGLTPQELQIVQLAAQGMANRDIAARLFLSPRTVAYHLYKAYPKLGVRSRGELAGLEAGRVAAQGGGWAPSG